ncbi:hypothetical protein RD792_004955 [Penstemon davidsonii]|uniref:Protein kinase domain-containing protein n=1 Tax=Penstemon davidsonii TaxID=160366 RepID=A0ABR0DJX9_9LAMI|nr:hypothetical protein RD792_004955 [Penstemon davidsonii]
MAAATNNQLNVEESPSWGSRSVDCFEKLELIGEGTYGQVYMAREKETGEIVALKKIRMDNEKEGLLLAGSSNFSPSNVYQGCFFLQFPITAIREIKILKKLQHENVIKLKEIVTSSGNSFMALKDSPAFHFSEKLNFLLYIFWVTDGNKYKGNIYMVFEYMDHDLTGLSDRPGLRFTVPQIKCYMKQLLTGLHYCHVNQVLHRDIKGFHGFNSAVFRFKYCLNGPNLHDNSSAGSNLLIDNEGNLKLADFGLARSFSSDHNANLTNRVITLWYRPPELLLGATKYGPAVDMWSVGCIFAELLYGKPILPGKNELSVRIWFVRNVFNVDEILVHSPFLQQPEQLNKIYELCGTPDELNWPGVSKIPCFDRHALDLLDKMLVLDPSQRIAAKDALDAEYFWTDPLPCDPKSLPKYESSHEYQTKKKRQQQRQNEEAAKRQKLQHPQQHARLPPIQQTGQAHPQHWNAPSHPLNNSQPPMPSLPSHQLYGKARGPPGGPNRYPPSGTSGGYYQDRGGQSGGYNSAPYPPQGRGPPYPGNNAPSNGPRGAGAAAGFGAPNYPQSSQYGVSGGRGSNPLGGNRNQQYNWQQ